MRLDRIHTKTTDGLGGARSLAGLGKRTRSMLLRLLAACSVALLAVGCNQGSPVGVYTYNRPGVLSKPGPERVEPPVTFILELRANGTYISTTEGVVRGAPPSVEGDLPSGRGTWELRDDVVIPCDIKDQALAAAPDPAPPYFRVPKVIDR